MTWFLFPPPSGISGASDNPEWLLERVFGNDAQARAVNDRLSEFAAADPQAADRLIEHLTGHPPEVVHRAIERGRQERLRSVLDHADDFDSAVERICDILDQLRQARLGALPNTGGEAHHGEDRQDEAWSASCDCSHPRPPQTPKRRWVTAERYRATDKTTPHEQQ